MTSYVTPKKNTAFILYVGLEDKANAGLFKAAPTLAAGDFKVSIDGGTLNNLTDLAEDPETVLSNVRRKLDTFDAGRLEKMLADYGSARTRRVFRQMKSGIHA